MGRAVLQGSAALGLHHREPCSEFGPSSLLLGASEVLEKLLELFHRFRAGYQGLACIAYDNCSTGICPFPTRVQMEWWIYTVLPEDRAGSMVSRTLSDFSSCQQCLQWTLPRDHASSLASSRSARHIFLRRYHQHWGDHWSSETSSTLRKLSHRHPPTSEQSAHKVVISRLVTAGNSGGGGR